MQQIIDYPVQMISVFSTLGDVKPLRFKYEDPEHQIITVDVGNILAHKELTMGPGGSIIYTCESEIDGRNRLYEVRYQIGTHKWILTKKLT